VTQKLETPVLYFYGADGTRVDVDVQFPRGIISEWFPNSESFSPPVGGGMPAIESGRMHWRVQLDERATAFPEVDSHSVWAPSRNVAATPIVAAEQSERFIFYRGLGGFSSDLTVTAEADTLTVKNASAWDVQAVFVLRLHGGGGAVRSLGGLAAGEATQFVVPTHGKEANPERYVRDASALVEQALIASGLYADEARAMVDTWSRSYFLTPGLRLLYIVPRERTDALLPLTLEPEPAELVRTLVGRIELMTPRDEADLLARVVEASRNDRPTSSVLTELGRFSEPKLRRVQQLKTVGGATSRYIDALVREATTLP